ncbi:MAG: hypothetical protein NXI15_02055 [Gammaproteobacteria bacterium]|nr:hypothetical protein [Gammaproteobacteria bacterium]
MQAVNHSENGVNLKLLHAAIRFNSMILGLTGGSLAAIIIYFATHASMARWGEDSGNYLGLLAVFFPGYSVSPTGAWLGALWAFVYVGTFSALSYRLYGRVLGTRISEILLSTTPTENPVLRPSIMRLHGMSLGLAIGAMAALGLFCSTAWLVIRGTAAESVHAALLANYIPGYSVSILGGLIGAIELFALVFLGCLLLAAVYNKVVARRHT